MRSIKRFLKNVAFACRAVYYVMLKPKTNIIAICTHGEGGVNIGGNDIPERLITRSCVRRDRHGPQRPH